MSDRFVELLDAYWAAAYQQGKDGRAHDDKDGSAQTAESNLCHFIDSLRVDVDEANARIKALEEENAQLRKLQRCECGPDEACQVMSGADARVKRLVEALTDLERYVSMECFDQWLPEGHAKTSVLSRKLDAYRAILKETGNE